ncbi:MAG: hypothetical protein R3320_14400, partial [Nitriliruptorales bacterium]|nr:hypothetical protein [Nitriliruptorales bacterium]
PWERIDNIRRLTNTGLLRLQGEWLWVDLDPGYLPDFRIPTLRLRRLEVWLLRRAGLRIGLHMLEADASAVIASIERCLPVAE